MTALRAHAVRDGHTLCGVVTRSRAVWCEPPAGCERCPECAAVPAGHATYLDMIGLGLTTRKLDYWTKQRHLRSAVSRGSGYRRTWPGCEYQIAEVMLRLMADQDITLRGAARRARQLVAPESVAS